jgi:periplasmic nitrate reductase NapD
MENKMNISSLVIKCLPEKLEETIEKLKNSELCEIHGHDEFGRIVVVLEGENVEDESEKLRRIQEMPTVISAEMVYAYSEDEFAPESGKFDRVSRELIATLNTETPAEDIVYHGHIKDK